MDLSGLGEFGLISRIRAGLGKLPEGVLGIGDDCAVLPQKDGRDSLVTTDMLMEGVQFLREDASSYDLGWKSAAVNLSDIAAMGGTPDGTFLAFALPKGLDSDWTDSFIRGYKDVSALSGTPLLGGDTTSSLDRICICVTVLGHCPAGGAVLRSGARPGDLVCVTGPTGDSGAGLKVILDAVPRGEEENILVGRHYRPVPRIEEGKALAAAGVSAMMDISDGIGSDLRHILEASGTGAVIRTGALPLSAELETVCARRGWDAVGFALDGGEDYELLFTVPAEKEPSLGVPHHVIGRITAEPGLVWEGDGGDHEGYRHF
jgi:thiamine-monophosphate kinase